MILFVEYRVLDPHLEEFARIAAEQPEWWAGAELLENTGQTGVYVEIWRVDSEREAEETKKKRREGRLWERLAPLVKGGADGVRMWTFRPVGPSGKAAAKPASPCNNDQALPPPPEPNGNV